MMFYGGEERIREGATVRERQSIITIPDMNKMSVRVRIHETYIKKVKKGQRAKITVDADFNKQFDFYNVSGSKDSKAIHDYLTRVSEMQRDKFTISFQVDSENHCRCLSGQNS